MENNPPRLSGAAKWLLIFGLLLVANSAYLAAFGDPTLFYVANALLHPSLGIIAAILLVVFVARHRNLLAGAGAVAAVGARPDAGRDRRYSTIVIIAGLFLVLAAAFGVYLMIVGMTRPHSLALYVHVSAAIVGMFLLLGILRGPSPRRPSHPRSSPGVALGRRGDGGLGALLWRGGDLPPRPPQPAISGPQSGHGTAQYGGGRRADRTA